MIPLSVPNFVGNELKYTSDAVSLGWVSTGGAYVSKFENDIAKYMGAAAAVACQSGTAALHLALIECGVTNLDIVIVPTLTFIAAVNPVSYLGASPVFMDCDDSLCLDPVKLEHFCKNKCIKEKAGLRHKNSGMIVKAVVVVHVFGNMADMEAIMEIAIRYGLKVVEDATEALGTYYTQGKFAGRYAGTIGDFGAFSFNGNKIITTGGGGMLVGNDEAALRHVKYLSTQAKDDELNYIHNEIGYNYRMTNVQAALGVAQLECLDTFIKIKLDNYEKYCELFAKEECYTILPFRDGTCSNHWFYSLAFQPEKLGISIDELVLRTNQAGIQTRPIWGLIHDQKPYANAMAYYIDKASYYSKRIINIPCSTNLTTADVEMVYNQICIVSKL